MKVKISIVLLALIAVALIAVAPAAAEVTTISQGGVVFVGEEGLTFQNGGVAVAAGTVLEWYASGDTPGVSIPSATYTCQGTGNEVIAPSTFQTRTGTWYLTGTTTSIINVMMPAIDVKAYNSGTAEDMTNANVVKDNTYITFRLDSNLYEGLLSRPNYLGTDQTDIKVVVVDEEGTVYTALYEDAALGLSSLTSLAPMTSQYYLPSGSAVATTLSPNWYLDLSDYKTGLYTFYAQVNLNNAKDNVGTVTGVTKSAVYTLDVSENYMSIESNKDTVVRNNDFSVTITGRPNEYYVLWVKGTSSVTAPDTAPFIKPNQDSVYSAEGATAQNLNAGLYQFSAGQAVSADVSTSGGDCYAMVKLASSGTRTVGFGTDTTTKDQTYTIRTDYFTGNALAVPAVAVVASNPTYDSVRVTIEAGDVTIAASGDSSYYIGEEIVLSGTNTDSDYTWLFITGPNLPGKGGSIANPSDGVNSALNAAGVAVSVFFPDGFLDSAPTENAWVGENVETDDTWEYKLDTAGVNLDAGTYTIYAVTTATNKDDLVARDATYATAYIAIMKPFITATTSPATIAKGNDISISGIATGDPTEGVAIWVLGKDYALYTTETVEDNGVFDYKLTHTENLAAGEYFVVAQHPMYNDLFDLAIQDNNPAAGQTAVIRPILDADIVPASGLYPPVFILEGTGSLQGSDAATALVNAMNSPDIDDICYELTFTIEEPWIMIDTIGERHAHETFIISGTTNLAPGNNLLISINSTNGIVPGSYGTALVTEGETDASNVWEYILDTTSYTLGDYTIIAEWIGATNQNTTQTFTLLEAEENPQSYQDVTISVASGWNLISTPVDAPAIASTGFLYNTAYAYNTTTSVYEEVPLADIIPGEGYWVAAFADAEIEFTGVPLSEYQRTLSTGWNMVGAIGIATETGSIHPSQGDLSGTIYCYDPEGYAYSQASILEPGVGYWISSTAPCTICVNITPPAAPA